MEPNDDITKVAAVLTVDECVQYLRIARGNYYEQIRLGFIPSIRIGRRILNPNPPKEGVGSAS